MSINLISTISLLVLDLLWLKIYMGPRYSVLVKKIQGSDLKINMISALLSYTLMVYLLNNVVIKYNLSYLETFLFGLSLYGVYDLTAGAIFKNWDFKLAIIDMIWGGLVYMISYYIGKNLNKLF